MMRKMIPGYIRRLLVLDDTPERIALAFSIGVFFAFSPLIGLHTFLGLLVAFLFGLNRAALLVGVFINNPWTLVPIYSVATYVGGLFIGFPTTAPKPQLEWKELFHSAFWHQLSSQWILFKQLLLGSSILSVFGALLSFLAVRFLIVKFRTYRAQQNGVIL
jgi:uncharacterized protein (DUF2062 family)